MLKPGDRRFVPKPGGGGDAAWVTGAVQTLFGQQGAGAGQTLFGTAPAKGQDGPDLATLVTDLFLIGIKIAETEHHGSPESLQRLIIAYIKEFERACITSGKPPDLVEHSKYAICAYMDEAVITHSAACREFWLAEPLQIKVCNDHNAGENFFLRLEQLLKDIRRNCEALDVYYLALALGFHGRYRLQGAEKLPIIISNLLLKIESVRGTPAKALAPSANVHPGKAVAERTGRLFIFASGGLLLLAALGYFSFLLMAGSPIEAARQDAKGVMETRDR